LGAASSRPIGFHDARVGVATVAAAALVAQQVVGKALRDTLFLGTFGVQNLPYAMIAAALLSGALVVALSRAAAARSARRVARAALGVSAALFVLAWAISIPWPRGAAAVTYLQAGALSAAVVSVFWSLVSEAFDPYAARASIPRIMAGATLGGVLGGVTAWRASAWMAPHDLLPLGAALNLAALAAVSRLRGAGPRPRPAGAKPGWRALAPELGSLRWVALLVAAAAATQAILDYLLSSSAVAAIGKGPQLLSFFALFQTAVGVLSFCLQVAVSRSALERFGVGPVLAASPSVLLGGALAALFLPPLASTVLLRGADGVLGASVHRSAYEVLFAPLDPRRKRAAKPLVDVGFDRLGTLLGGGIVAVVIASTSAVPMVLLAFVAALAVFRLVLSRRLQSGYRRSLAEILEQGRLATSMGTVLDRATIATLSQAAGEHDRRKLLEDVEAFRAQQAEPRPDDAARLSIAAFDVPACPEPDEGPGDPGAREDEVISALRALRSGHADRARAILRRRRTEPVLAPQVVELLADDRVARDAADWLTAQVPSPTGLLADALLSDELSDAARRRVARLLGKSEDPRAAEALLAALTRVPTGVRPGLADALARAAARRPLPADPLLRAAARAAEEASGDDRAQLQDVFALLSAAYPGEPILPALHALERGGTARGTALEWLDVLLPHEVKRALWPRIVRSGERIPATARDANALRTAVGAEPLTPMARPRGEASDADP
jgi:ATP/ADP translocase